MFIPGHTFQKSTVSPGLWKLHLAPKTQPKGFFNFSKAHNIHVKCAVRRQQKVLDSALRRTDRKCETSWHTRDCTRAILASHFVQPMQAGLPEVEDMGCWGGNLRSHSCFQPKLQPKPHPTHKALPSHAPNPTIMLGPASPSWAKWGI